MKKLLMFLILVLVIGGCSDKSSQGETENLFEEAVRLAEEYKLEEAREKFIELSELDPNSPEGYYGLGLIYEKQFLLYDALEVYMTIKNTRPTFAPALEGCWRLYNYFDFDEEALQLAGTYNNLLPEQPEPKVMLAKVFINGSVPTRAGSYLDTALIMGGNQDIADLVRAQFYISVHKPDSAELYYQSGFSNSDPNPEALMEAANYLEMKGLIDSAIVVSRRAMAEGDDYNIWFNHYRLAMRNDYFNEASNVIKKFREAGIPNEAITTLETLFYYKTGKFTPSRHNLDKMVYYSQKTLSYRMYQMEIRGSYGDEMTLMQDYEVVLGMLKQNDSDPEFSDLIVYQAAMLFTEAMNDMSGVIRIEQVSTKFYSKADYYLRNSYVYFRTGQHDEFESRIKNVLKTHNRHPNWMTGLGDLYRDIFIRRYDDAAKLYTDALTINERYRPAFESYVEMHRKLNNFGKALDLFKKYPNFEESYPELAVLKALCLIENNQTEKGMNLFLDKIGYLRGDLGWFQKVEKVLYKTGEFKDKIRLADWLSENNVENINALNFASDIYCDTKEYKKAKQVAEKALELDPENMTASVMNARSMYYLGNVDEAINIMKNNNEKNSFHIANNMYLSRLMALEGIEPNNAENIARKAVFDSQSDFEPWLNLSFVYYNNGRFDLARGEASKISRSHLKNPEQPEAVFQIGMALYMEGNSEATEKLQEAIDLGLSGESLTTAKETLRKI